VAGGPHPIVKRINAFVTNRYWFHTQKRDKSKKTQNALAIYLIQETAGNLPSWEETVGKRCMKQTDSVLNGAQS